MYDKKGKRASSRGRSLNKVITEYGGKVMFDEARQNGEVWEKKMPSGRSLWFDYEEEDYADEGVDDSTEMNGGKRMLSLEDAGKMRAVTETNLTKVTGNK